LVFVFGRVFRRNNYYFLGPVEERNAPTTMKVTLALSLEGVNFTLTPLNEEGSLEFTQDGEDYLVQLNAFTGTLRAAPSTGTTPKTTNVLKRRVQQSNETSKKIREELAKADDVSVATDLLLDEIVETPAPAGHCILERTNTTTSPTSQTSQDPTLHVSQPTLLGQPDFSQTQFSDTDSHLYNEFDDESSRSPSVISKPARVSLGTSPASIAPTTKGGESPCPRWGHTMTAVDKNRVLVYGGQTLDKNTKLPVTLQDLFLFDCSTKTWFKPFNCLGLPRQWHTATYLPERRLLISFGGEAVDPKTHKVKNESTVMVLDTEIMLWYPPTVSGDVPSSRSGHTATVLGNDLVVFGGVRGRKWLNTVSILDCTLWKWTTPKVVGAAPQPRSYHTAVAMADNNRIVIFGGNNADTSFDTVHVLEKISSTDDDGEMTTKWKWAHPTVTGGKPKARTGHSATLLDNGTTIWIYGGWDPNADDDNDNCADNDDEMIFGDSFYLDTTQWVWRSGPSLHNGTKRVGHAAVLNEANDVCVFGGRVPGDVFSDDLYTLVI
jgi:Galactose oxidase, central domain/Kelch motif